MASADNQYCGASSHGYVLPGAETCETYYAPASSTYQHQGNASYFLAYVYNFPSTFQHAQSALSGAGHNMFSSPTTNSYRIDNTTTYTEIHWDRPDNRTFCWYGVVVHGPDTGLYISSQLAAGCGPY